MTPTELLEGLERDGILRVVETRIQTDEAVVSLHRGGNVGQLVELLGIHRHLSLVALAVVGTLYEIQDRAWDEGNWDLADQIAQTRFDLGTEWLPLPIVSRVMNAYREGRTS